MKYLLLILSFILFITGSNANETQSETLPEGCYTYSECQQTIKDPYEDFNRSIFTFNDKLDKYFLKPIAEGYHIITPQFIEIGVSNFFDNMEEPATALNSYLQGKGNRGSVATTRFLLNSVFGLLGLWDFASWFGITEFNETLDQTLATWGVESGPYIVLPFLGPSTVRGGLTYPVSSFLTTPPDWPNNKYSDYSLPFKAFYFINLRASLLEASDIAEKAALDPYNFYKNAYYQNLRNQIYDGSPPILKEESEEEEELDGLLDDLIE